ncbi:DyP-type peroxidase [Crepidotus variabilis]|uniref:DyP-type peroxidase n=1 Tax=Crepidotus variabilis TaxID=179855 RepID=A0A9P6EKW6_9AGAR|nr:DyP-type peroxidase [Crepidotus variabilis]
MSTQAPIPAPAPVTPSPPSKNPTEIDLGNIQGDILSGLPKKTETFYFFQIIHPVHFKRDLRQLIPLIKTVADVGKDRKKIQDYKDRVKHHPEENLPPLIHLAGVNIALSHLAFEEIGIDDSKLDDPAFTNGQLKDSESLKDKGTGTGPTFVPDWEEPFKKPIHGVIIVTGDCHPTVDKTVQQIENIFDVNGSSPSISLVTSIRGDVRPGDLSAHEHFGYLDGVSNPAVIGFDKDPAPGPKPVPAGKILLGHDGDANRDKREPWMVDGSFLVFRYLFQKVPEFDDFVERSSGRLVRPGLDKKEAADLLGARLVGRWKSGAPIDITPFHDNPHLAENPQRNNDFSFSAEINVQKLCPFASHVRRTMPRDDIPEDQVEAHRILRRGIQFGPEVTKQEKRTKTTMHGRGLLFACYQSSISDGFRFIQTRWSNNVRFPPGETTPETPGLDPIIGQGTPADRKMSGFNPDKPSDELAFDDLWVVPRGGEYFFSPSIEGLKDIIAA